MLSLFNKYKNLILLLIIVAFASIQVSVFADDEITDLEIMESTLEKSNEHAKTDYINEIYRPLLKMGLMKEYYLILPLSDRYKGTYIKDLCKDSDIIICDLTKSNFFLNIELNTAKKLNKKI